MEFETLLNEELQSELKALGEIDELGTETYKVTVDGIVKLMDRKIEIDRLKAEMAEKEANHDFQVKQNKEEQVFKLIGHGLTLIGLISSVGLAVWGTNKTLKFEETGTVTTMAGRSFIGRLFPKK